MSPQTQSGEAAKPRRRPGWHPVTIASAFLLGRRPGDSEVRAKAGRATKAGAKVTALGLVGWALMSSMTMVSGLLKAQTAALQELPRAVAQAIKERDAERQGEAAWVVSEMQALRAETAQHQAADAVEFAQLRGVVAGRLRCPPCPACGPCQATTPPPAKPPEQRFVRER